jgi:hypothetical protein
MPAAVSPLDAGEAATGTGAGADAATSRSSTELKAAAEPVETVANARVAEVLGASAAMVAWICAIL